MGTPWTDHTATDTLETTLWSMEWGIAELVNHPEIQAKLRHELDTKLRPANNPDQWKKHEEFRPERFLEEEAKVETSGNDFRYLPFGFGRRSCPGMILAFPIMGITLGRLVQKFELLPPPGQSMIDTSANVNLYNMHISKHSTVVAKPRSF
ncbi:trans-cinnamate 4-monooxygenase [Tanacetum coccineum]